MKLIPKFDKGGYTPRMNELGKPILNPDDPRDVKWLRELQAKRGKQYHKEGMREARPLAIGLAALTASPALLGFGIKSAIKPLDVAENVLDPTGLITDFALTGTGRLFKSLNKSLKSPAKTVPLNVGWGPKQTIHVVHDKTSNTPITLYFPERWDAVHEGAPKFGAWFLGKLGQPRTALTNSKPGKAEKAVKARELFANRKYRAEGDLTLDKPMITVGDVPNRALLEHYADKAGADGVIFNNVYDNGYDNNQVIFSYKNLDNPFPIKKGEP